MEKKEVPKLAFILAGGEGTRLRPITYEIPKPLMPVKGKPVLEHVFDELDYYGVERFVLSIGYKSEQIINYFNKSKYADRVEYIVEPKLLGTGGAMKYAAKKLLAYGYPDFLDVYGDNLTELNHLHEMYEIHKKEKALVTLGLFPVEDVSGFGIAELEGNKIVRFIEKPKPGETESHLHNSGMYIVSTKLLSMLPDEEVFSIEKDFFPKVLAAGKLYGYQYSGQNYRTDNLERYEDAIKNWKPLHERRKK